MRARCSFSVLVVLVVLVLIAGFGVASGGSRPAAPAAQSSADLAAADVRSPVLVVENAGQWPGAARYQVWGGPAGPMWLADDAIWLTVLTKTDGQAEAGPPEEGQAPGKHHGLAAAGHSPAAPSLGAHVRISFTGANPHPLMEPVQRLDTKVNYLLGADPSRWRQAVPVWGGVRYVDLYPGIDLVIGGEAGNGSPFWALEAGEGADTSAVRLSIEGADAVVADGALVRLAAGGGEIGLPLIAANFSYAVNGALVDGRAQAIAAQDESQHWTPADNPAELVYSSYVGGYGYDSAHDTAVDASGRIYLAGRTESNNFPATAGAFDRSLGGEADAFAMRWEASGNGLEYATFLGGADEDGGNRVAVDASGRAYVAGFTGSSDFPTTAGAFDRSFNGVYDNFIVRLNAGGGSLDFATFLGGSGDETTYGIATDASGRAYVTGRTESGNFPTTAGAFDRSLSGDQDAFVARVNASGSALEYAAFMGGSDEEEGTSITVDATGRAYVTGATASDDFPTTAGAYDRSFNGVWDAFVVRVSANGGSLEYATLLGGSEDEDCSGIVVDTSGRAYLAGETESSDFPTTAGVYDRSFNGDYDAFIARLNAGGGALEFATFLGGSGDDDGYGVDIDASGRVYVTGYAESSNFPTTAGAYDRSYNGGGDVFVARLDAGGAVLQYATFLGGNGEDSPENVVATADGRTLVVGRTESSNFPTTAGAFDRSYEGAGDAFLVKLALGSASAPTATPTTQPHSHLPVVRRNYHPSAGQTRTPTATPTRAATASRTPTPTRTRTPTQTQSRVIDVYGRVKAGGQPVKGIRLILWFHNGASWSILGSPMSTDAAGNYRFSSVPSLTAGQKYVVEYRNARDGNPDNRQHVWRWTSFAITTTIANASVAGGDFDIAGVEMTSPGSGATVTLPRTFTWQTRPATPGDSYSFHLHDPADDDPVYTIGVGSKGSYELASLPAGFDFGTTYGWLVYIDNNGGNGISYYYYYITFKPSGLESPGGSPAKERDGFSDDPVMGPRSGSHGQQLPGAR